MSKDAIRVGMNGKDYGPEIPAKDIRSGWLKEGEPLLARGIHGTVAVVARNLRWPEIFAIRLLVDHPYYAVQAYNEKHGTQFKYWPGGDNAPGDWDRRHCLTRANGTTVFVKYWAHKPDPSWSGQNDIIGYTPKDTRGFAEDLANYEPPMPEPVWKPDERTVRLCIETLPEGYDGDTRLFQSNCVDALEALLPKPDRAAELVAEWTRLEIVVGVDPDVAARAFARWAIERGGIEMRDFKLGASCHAMAFALPPVPKGGEIISSVKVQTHGQLISLAKEQGVLPEDWR